MRVTPSCDSINSLCISDATGIQQVPDIAYGGGTYLVVWSDMRGGSSIIFGARVSPSGTLLDPSGIAFSPISCEMPAIEFDGSRFLVVWGRSSNIEGVFVTTGGGTQETVAIATGSTILYSPNIAFDGVNYLVVWLQWNGSAYDMVGQRVSASGTLVGPQIAIGATLLSSKPGLSFDGVNYIISWTESFDIYARKYTPSGAPTGPAFPVSTHDDVQLFNDVCSGANRYLFIWAQITGAYDIYGNVDIAIGINEEDSDVTPAAIIISNVITDQICFDNPDYHLIKLYDSKGCLIGQTTGNRFNSHDLAPGVYFIRVEDKPAGKIIKIR